VENYNLQRILQKAHKLAGYHLDDQGELGDLSNEVIMLIDMFFPDLMHEALEKEGEDRTIPALLPSSGSGMRTGMRALTSMRL
jgi:hypothetical protein